MIGKGKLGNLPPQLVRRVDWQKGVSMHARMPSMLHAQAYIMHCMHMHVTVEHAMHTHFAFYSYIWSPCIHTNSTAPGIAEGPDTFVGGPIATTMRTSVLLLAAAAAVTPGPTGDKLADGTSDPDKGPRELR